MSPPIVQRELGDREISEDPLICFSPLFLAPLFVFRWIFFIYAISSRHIEPLSRWRMIPTMASPPSLPRLRSSTLFLIVPSFVSFVGECGMTPPFSNLPSATPLFPPFFVLLSVAKVEEERPFSPILFAFASVLGRTCQVTALSRSVHGFSMPSSAISGWHFDGAV